MIQRPGSCVEHNRRTRHGELTGGCADIAQKVRLAGPPFTMHQNRPDPLFRLQRLKSPFDDVVNGPVSTGQLLDLRMRDDTGTEGPDGHSGTGGIGDHERCSSRIRRAAASTRAAAPPASTVIRVPCRSRSRASTMTRARRRGFETPLRLFTTECTKVSVSWL